MMKPVFSQLEGRGDYEGIKSALLTVTKISALLSAFIGLSVIYYGKAFIFRWMGPGYDSSYYVAAICRVGFIIELPQFPGIELLFGLSKHKYYAVLNGVEALLNVVLSVILLKYYGLYGVVLGTAIEILIIKLFVLPVYICRTIRLRVREYLFDTILMTLAKSAVPLGIYFYLIRGVVLPDYTRLILCVAGQSLLFIPAAYFFILSRSERMLINRALRLDEAFTALGLRVGAEQVNVMAETEVADDSTSADSVVHRALRAVLCAMVLWIPVETLFVFGSSDDSGRSGGGITVSKLLGFLLLGLALIEWRRCFRRIPVAFWLVACYLAVFALSELWIPRYLDAKFHAIQFTSLQMVALFVISANLLEDAEFRGALMRIYGWCVSLAAVGMMLVGDKFVGQEGRTTLLGQDPNFTAATFALGAICIAGNPRLFAPKRVIARAIAALLAIVVLIMAILQTGSRGGLIAFVVGIMGLAICGGRASRKKRILIAGLFIAALGVLVLREFQQGTTAASRLSNTWNDGDTAGRTEIYGVAWSMFLERPLLGYGGVNNFAMLGERLNFSDGATYYRGTHNLLLSLLTEVGLVGTIPFLAAIFYVLWRAWRYSRDGTMPCRSPSCAH